MTQALARSVPRNAMGSVAPMPGNDSAAAGRTGVAFGDHTGMVVSERTTGEVGAPLNLSVGRRHRHWSPRVVTSVPKFGTILVSLDMVGMESEVFAR